mgnify:CR=1 FL=1
MKKVFIVEAEKVTWDQYDSVIVLAESEEEAIALGQGFFETDQGKISAREVDLNGQSGVIFTSFNAG